jgi:hypothetical protein
MREPLVVAVSVRQVRTGSGVFPDIASGTHG